MEWLDGGSGDELWGAAGPCSESEGGTGGARVDCAARMADSDAVLGDVHVVSIDDLLRTAHGARFTIDVGTIAFDAGGRTSDLAPWPSHDATLNIDQAPRRINAKK